MTLPSRGLYLLTNDDPWPILQNKLHAALSSGVAVLQYRRKHTPADQQDAEATAMLEICQQYQVPLIINDDVALAERLGCGVHLGQGDGCLHDARARLGQSAMIGRTCHDSLVWAKQAIAQGASYVAFGAVYASATKPHAQAVSLATLQQATATLGVPVCAIGGLSVENSQPLVDCGIHLYAVVGDVLGVPVNHVSSRVQQWQALLDGTGV
ncbi:MAG: hypothetical protein RLY58_778 [Pseudomonadota bacterium]|jgi:thiamine-phosphate pyrophosphorylase